MPGGCLQPVVVEFLFMVFFLPTGFDLIWAA